MAKRRDSRLVRLIAHSVWHALFLALMVIVGGMLLTPSSAHAAPYTGNYQLDLQVTNGPFSYGGSTLPQFQATLTALNGTTLSSCTGSTFVTIAIDTEPGATWGSNSQSASGANTCVYTYVGEPPDWGHYATGLRTATAQATVSGQVVATGTATFMVNKIVTSISCFVNTPGSVYQSGSTLQIGQQVQGPDTNYTPDWTQSKFDITFTGPENVTYTNITPDMTPGAGWLNVRAPTTPGYYNMTCAFDGYGNYAPSTSGAVGAYISAFNQIGGIKLYTNPTTYNPYKSCVVYIVFQAAPGGPTPTGNTSLTIGRNYTASVDIASNGTLSVRLNPLPLPGGANQITVDYSGDAHYRWASSTFSFTNPAIPSNAPPSSGSINSSGGGKAGSPQATTTATAPGTASVATPSPAGAHNASAVSSSSGSSGGSPLLWIGLGVLVLGLGGGGLALVVRARLAKPRLSVPFQAPRNTGWPQSLDEPPF